MLVAAIYVYDFYRQDTCDRVGKERGLAFIPPYDHYDVIAGQVGSYYIMSYILAKSCLKLETELFSQFYTLG